MEENSRICKKCKESKNICEFGINKKKADGIEIYCRHCCREKAKIIREKIKVIPESKKCNDCGVNKKSEFFSKTSSSPDGLSYVCRSCSSIKNKEKYTLNREEDLAKQKRRREKKKEDNLELLRAQEKQSRIRNKKNRKTYNKQYTKNYNIQRKKNDPLFKLSGNIRSLIKIYLSKNGTRKSKKTEKILGCNFEEFKLHIESQFESWMSWDNYGNCESSDYGCSWHLDHIIPMYYAKNEEDLYLLNHFSNFQPLCGYKNLEKGRFGNGVCNIVLNIIFEFHKISSK